MPSFYVIENRKLDRIVLDDDSRHTIYVEIYPPPCRSDHIYNNVESNYPVLGEPYHKEIPVLKMYQPRFFHFFLIAVSACLTCGFPFPCLTCCSGAEPHDVFAFVHLACTHHYKRLGLENTAGIYKTKRRTIYT
jgi:hypothetical protein